MYKPDLDSPKARYARDDQQVRVLRHLRLDTALWPYTGHYPLARYLQPWPRVKTYRGHDRPDLDRICFRAGQRAQRAALNSDARTLREVHNQIDRLYFLYPDYFTPPQIIAGENSIRLLHGLPPCTC